MLMQGNDPYQQKLDINNLLNFPHNMKASHKQSLCQPFSVLFEKIYQETAGVPEGTPVFKNMFKEVRVFE